MSDSPVDPRAEAALARNDRYIREFVEAFSFCPYAKRCRETGRLHRVVLLDAGGAPESDAFDAVVGALVEAIEAVEQLPADSVEVALILFPALASPLSEGMEGARAFEKLVSAARDRMQVRHTNRDTPFYCVAFHPHFPGDLSDAHRAVRFIRRSPDPTVQLVRASVLRAVRGVNPGGAHYVNIAGMTASELMAVAAPVSVGDRIAEANLRTLGMVGAGRLGRLQAEIAAHGREPKS